MQKIDEQRLEQEIFNLGSAVFKDMAGHQRSRLDPQFYTDRLMEFAMQDEELKVSLFRFVDVLPSLESAAAVIQHVHEYFEPVKDRIPGFLQKGFSVAPDSLTSVVAARAIRQQVRFIADRFIVGETADKALSSLRKIRKQGFAFTVDLVGEAAVGKSECREYAQRYIDLLQKLGKATAKWPEAAPIIPGHKAEITPIHISVKLSALYSQAKPIATEATTNQFQEQLSEILAAAKQVGAYVFVDMEDSALVEPTLAAFKRTLLHPVFRDYGRCGIVLQAYLRRTEADFEDLLEWAKKRGVPIGVRLVKGAYWDTETILARQRNWPIPVWQSKSCSDAVYERLSRRLLENRSHIVPAFGSHNVRSLVHACSLAKLGGIPNTDFELQTLYGMAPEIKKAFASRGYLVREYAPVGELIPGMGYLVRRLLENTSNEGFLRRSSFEKLRTETLLTKPTFDPKDDGFQHIPEQRSSTTADSEARTERRFSNEPLSDYSIPEQRTAVLAEIKHLRSSLPIDVSPLVGGKELRTTNSMRRLSPDDGATLVAEVQLASKEQTEEALQSLREFFPEWRATPVAERAELLRKAAQLMRERRNELIALVVLEVGKPITEADADVAEAIDFCEYYARDAQRLCARQKLPSPPGEINSYWYEARGITAVISPWNFPFAIPCGMFSASLVCGNTVLLKPAEQSSAIAQALFSIFLDAGMPPKAAAFLPGWGEEVGALLADHPEVDTICFTGSKQVGLELIDHGARKSTQGRHVRKVVAEMGGKNAILVDEDADLDEAVKGVVKSAFGYAGQKCSACSRAIVIGSAYERFSARLKDAVESLPFGAAADPASTVGPVVDEESQQRLLSQISDARKECRVLAEHPGAAELGQGYFVKPIVFADVPADHSLITQELFGPVLTIEFADSIEAAIAMALKSEYALTGAVYSRSPKTIELVMQEFRVGNLYINTGSTGALVGRQPFGGASMSGVGSKAGGPDYLLQFVIPRAASENSIRRGFAPLAL